MRFDPTGFSPENLIPMETMPVAGNSSDGYVVFPQRLFYEHDFQLFETTQFSGTSQLVRDVDFKFIFGVPVFRSRNSLYAVFAGVQLLNRKSNAVYTSTYRALGAVCQYDIADLTRFHQNNPESSSVNFWGLLTTTGSLPDAERLQTQTVTLEAVLIDLDSAIGMQELVARRRSLDMVDQPATGVDVVDATASQKGIIRLSGDLEGTADQPRVKGLANLVTMATADLRYALKNESSVMINGIAGPNFTLDAEDLGAYSKTDADSNFLTPAQANQVYVRKVNNQSPDAQGNVNVPGGAGQWGSITGDIEAQADLFAYIGRIVGDQTGGINRNPVGLPITKTLEDRQSTISFNLLEGATDVDGDAMSVDKVFIGETPQPVGTAFDTQYGTMLIQANGAGVLTLGAGGNALDAGETAELLLQYQLRDVRGGVSFRKPLTITIVGTNQTPVARSDMRLVLAGRNSTGNVLTNDLDYEGDTKTLTQFTIAGESQTYLPGQVASIATFGTVAFQSNGDFVFTPLNDTVKGVTPLITYTGTDGTNTYTQTLRLSVSPPPPTEADMRAFYASYRQPPVIERPAPNPVVGRPLPDRTVIIPTTEIPAWDYSLPLPNQLGRPANALDFEVGPGKPYPELQDVPWEYLLPGDRVFVYWREEPYKTSININSSGLADAWIEVIGVADPTTKKKPVFDGKDGFAADGRHVDIYDGKAFCSIHVLSAGIDGMINGAKTRYIHVTGFEIRNVGPTFSRTDRKGYKETWGLFGSAFYIIGAEHICIQGNDIHHCGNGIFANSVNGERFQTRWLHVCNNWIHDCSDINSFHTHTIYIEATFTIYEHNYLQKVVVGSNGDTVKDRSAGVVFRYNFVETSANGLALRDPSSEYDSSNGWLEVQVKDTFGDFCSHAAFVYGNTFLGDNDNILGVGDGQYSQYRQGSVYFYNNVVINYVDGVSAYIGIYYDPVRVPLFAMLNTRELMTVVARNNLFYTQKRTSAGKTAQFGIFFWQGIADFQSNWINDFIDVAYDTNYAASQARGERYNGTGLGGLTRSSDSPGFNSLEYGDYRLRPTSPYFQLQAPVPAYAVARGLVPERDAVAYPFDMPPLSAAVVAPQITGSRVEGGTVTVSGYVFMPVPESYLIRWYADGVVIPNETGTDIITTGLKGKSLYAGVRAVNSAGEPGPEAITTLFPISSGSAPLNSVAPTVTGSKQVTFPHSVSLGEWTNSPVRYEFQVYLNSVPVAGEITDQYTPSIADEGKTLTWMVTAFNAQNESSFAMSNAITLGPVSFNPDAFGKYQFQAADGTVLSSFSPDWDGVLLDYGYGNNKDHFTVQGNALQSTSGTTLWSSARVWLIGNKGDNCPVSAEIFFTETDFSAHLGLRQTVGQYYRFELRPTGVRVVRNGALVASKLDMAIASPAVYTIRPNGGTFNIYVNETLVLTYTDPTPLTGGYPGLCSERGGNSNLQAGWNWWTDVVE